MYQLYPYFTNDGSVGLFSPEADDVYHSTYGAVSESWQKFVEPSHLKDFIKQNDSIKILDICYGIGYNTKAALKVFFENYFEEKKYQNKKNIIKKSSSCNNSIEQIHTDNILSCNNQINEQNQKEKLKNADLNKCCIDKIDTDNISSKILHIDAVDMDKILIQLSPFIIPKKKFSLLNKEKYFFKNLTAQELDKLTQVKKIKKDKKIKLTNDKKIDKEINIILLKSLIENNKYNYQIFEDENIQEILSNKKYSAYFDSYMINFAKSHLNYGYKYKEQRFKTSFLHNIYYQYLSKSYKKALEITKNNKIDINLHNNDARAFVNSSEETYDFIFLDAFTPAKCPALWTKEFFEQLYRLLNKDGMLLTYATAAPARNAMLSCGFYIGKIYNPDMGKFTGTVATKNKDLIEYDLTEKEIGLVKTKAGICYRDESFNLSNNQILAKREEVVKNSDLMPSARYLRSFKK